MKCKPSEDVCLEHCLPLMNGNYCADGCPHQGRFRAIVRDSIMIDGRIRVMSRLRCIACLTWLPLGQSNDDTEAVRVEIRAAELAFNDGPIRTCDNAMPDDCEECGWDCWPLLNAMHDAEPAQWAGYLARCIATHQDDTP